MLNSRLKFNFKKLLFPSISINPKAISVSALSRSNPHFETGNMITEAEILKLSGKELFRVVN